MHEFRCQFSEVRVEELYMSRGLLNFERLPTACLVLTSAILFFAFACGKSEPPKPRPPDVDVVQVEQKDVPIWKEWIGTLDGLVNAQIKPQVTGYLLRQTYKDGAFVKKDQLLFEIDPRTFQAAVDQAKGQTRECRRPARGGSGESNQGAK